MMDSCILCKSSKKDDVQYGEFLKNTRFGVHTFCLYLSSNLSQNGKDDEGFLGFLEQDIKKEVKRISFLKCCYCQKTYANVGCCERKCRRSFHFICGLEHNAENQFCHDYRSFCNKHVRKERQSPPSNASCLICYDSLCAAGKRFKTILSPCCRNGWFHKLCLQKFAKTAGYFFKCPLCNDVNTFREKLPAKGIFIPNQDAAWELEPNAFAELLERPNECTAQRCENKKGRKATSDNNPLVLCSTCGATAMHKQCLPNGGTQFNCVDCLEALDEGDSGRESVNLSGNDDNQDECIDVCHVSDKEDFDIIDRLFVTNSQMKESKRDSGTHYDVDGGDEEMSQKLNNSNTDEDDIKPVAATRRRRLRIDSGRSDLQHSPKTRIRNDTESSADILEDKTSLRGRKRNTKRIKSIFGKRRSPNILNIIKNSDSEDQEEGNIKSTLLVVNMPAASKGKMRFRRYSEDSDLQQSPKTRTRNDTESSADNLEEGTSLRGREGKTKQSNSEISETSERKKPIFGKRKSPDIFNNSDSEDQEESSIKTAQLDVKNDKSITDSEINIKNIENNSFSSEEEFVISSRKRKCLIFSTESEEELNLSKPIETESDEDDDPVENFSKFLNKKIALGANEVKHLANTCGIENNQARTAICKKIPNQLKLSQNSPKKENKLDYSCVARRTRRNFTSNSYSNKLENKGKQKDEFVALTRRNTICVQTDHSKESLYEMSQFYEKIHESKEVIKISDTDESECEHKFDTSCIANRTRRRLKYKSSLQNIDKILDCNSDTSNSSDVHINIGRRCNRRITYSLRSTTSASNINTKVNSNVFLNKQSQRNYVAFLHSNNTANSSNAVNNYHHANYCLPRSNYRKRF